jgi:hypothetical protein
VRTPQEEAAEKNATEPSTSADIFRTDSEAVRDEQQPRARWAHDAVYVASEEAEGAGATGGALVPRPALQRAAIHRTLQRTVVQLRRVHTRAAADQPRRVDVEEVVDDGVEPRQHLVDGVVGHADTALGRHTRQELIVRHAKVAALRQRQWQQRDTPSVLHHDGTQHGAPRVSSSGSMRRDANKSTSCTGHSGTCGHGAHCWSGNANRPSPHTRLSTGDESEVLRPASVTTTCRRLTVVGGNWQSSAEELKRFTLPHGVVPAQRHRRRHRHRHRDTHTTETR